MSTPQAQNSAHALNAVERRDELHLRCAWIGKAGVDTTGNQTAHQRLGAVHAFMIQHDRVLDCRARVCARRLFSIDFHTMTFKVLRLARS